MKKTGLFKIIMFILLGIVIATWIFSASYFNNNALSDLQMKNIGFFDYFSLLFGSFQFEYFLQAFLLLICIGAFYGVLEKTGVYRAWVERIVKNCRGKEFTVLVLVAFVMAILTAVFEYGFTLFIFVPFLISVLLAMGYNKITTIMAIFGSMLVGTLGNLIGYNTVGSLSKILEIGQTEGFYYRLGLFVFAFILELIFLSNSKRDKLVSKKYLEENDMFIGEKKDNGYNVAGIVAAFVVLFVCMILGCTYWVDSFNIGVFSKLHTAITEWSPKLPYIHITLNGIQTGTEKVAIISKLLGTVSELGKWYYPEMSVLLIISSLILGKVYKLKSTISAMAEGAKKVLKPAFMVLLCYTVVYFAGMNMFFPTIAKVILGISSKFNVILGSIVTAIGSVLHVDILYVSNYISPQLASIDGANKVVVAILSQAIYGCTMFIAPTSMFLVFALTYLDVPYKDWVKKTWKLTLSLFVASIAIVFIANSL